MDQSTSILIAAVINAVVVVGGFLLNHLVRQRADQGARKASEAATATQTVQIEKTIELTRLQLELKAIEAASAAREAYHEANDANLKIATLQEQLRLALSLLQPKTPTT